MRAAEACQHVRPLMGRNLPDYSQILYKIPVQQSNPQPPADAPRAGSNELKGPFSRYGVDFAVAPEDLKLNRTPDRVLHGAIEVMLVVYDSEGKPLNTCALAFMISSLAASARSVLL